MRFNVAINSADIQAPVHIFPGDTFEDLNDYPEIIMNGYITSVATLYGAAESLDVHFDTETFERAKRIGAASGLLDDFLDGSPDIDQAVALYNEGLDLALHAPDKAVLPDGIHPYLESSIRLLLNSVETLSAEHETALIRAAQAIGAIALKKSKVSQVDQYITLLDEEAQHTAVLLHGIASRQVRLQPNFGKLQEWGNNAIKLAVFADSSWDLWTDHRRGRTAVPATVANSMRIASNAVGPLRALNNSRAVRRATRASLYARLRFSLQPTTLLIPRDNGSETR
jgi:hypothetical protein